MAARRDQFGEIVTLLLLMMMMIGAGNANDCNKDDYHFVYTECDSKGHRWRVAVPKERHQCSNLPYPSPGRACSFSCPAGHFLNMSLQICQPCPPGTYSLGSGLRFDSWENLPEGFITMASSQNEQEETSQLAESCIKSTWKPMGNYIESNADDCASSLSFTVKLKQPGKVEFRYQYPSQNIFFEFYVQNEQCNAMLEDEQTNRPMPSIGNEWKTHKVKLPEGNTVMSWRTAGVGPLESSLKPVRIQSVFITGVAYSSTCSPCPPGTYSMENGTTECFECKRNTYALRGFSRCQPCHPKMFSDPGSSVCKIQQPCGDGDYYRFQSPCIEHNMTRITFHWVEPKVCLDDVPSSVKLPPEQVSRCAPCNPGYSPKPEGGCFPCPRGTISIGSAECTACPTGMEPMYGFEYRWWGNLPENMEVACFSSDVNCDAQGWHLARDYIQMGHGSSDNDYFVLMLKVHGFKSTHAETTDAVAEIRFEFETNCTVECELFFTVTKGKQVTQLKQSWLGSQSRNVFLHHITSESNTTFSWIFQKTPVRKGQKLLKDYVRMYSISVSNVIDGVASKCRVCARRQDNAGCIPCPPGSYINSERRDCVPCPSGTFLATGDGYTSDRCVDCGPGTISNKNRTECQSNCRFEVTVASQHYRYNYQELARPIGHMVGPRFTTRGMQYFLAFNISLCGNDGRKEARCIENMTDVTNMDMEPTVISSFVCRESILPANLRHHATVSTNVINLGSQLIGVSVEESLRNITSPGDIFPRDQSLHLPDIIHYYRSHSNTEACPQLRTTTIRLRCSLYSAEPEGIFLPTKCPEGTCDGCSFHLLWRTPYACPLCGPNDFKEIAEACHGGKQRLQYIWRTPRLCVGDDALPDEVEQPCELIGLLGKTSIALGFFFSCSLLIITGIFYRKNRNLEYKYMSLVTMSDKTRDDELPAVDSCAIMEGDEEEEMVTFSGNDLGTGGSGYKSKALFHKLWWKDRRLAKDDFGDLRKLKMED
uniref:endosome/lysosome-associated apoptosis and autophagy regulator family member 2-like n=1 Tax=Myxine glutinosa TaxID=7769 RepID=UPI00358E19CC